MAVNEKGNKVTMLCAIRRAAMRAIVPGMVLAAVVTLPGKVGAQQIITQAQQTVRITRGQTALIRLEAPPTRVVLGDPTIAEIQFPEAARGTEALLIGQQVGVTNLILWYANGRVDFWSVEVAPNIGPLQDQIRTIFPDANITVTTSGNAVIISGVTQDPGVVRRVMQLAQQITGAQVINNIQAPTAEQILLHVRFAEITKSALRRLGTSLLFQNLSDVNTIFDDERTTLETLSEGLVRLSVVGDDAGFDAVINALRSSGELRSLAEPNLLALEGQEATFLAGGEFPFPIVQGGAATGVNSAVTIQFKEFGVRLSFTPNVTPSGTIRLRVAPEVSALDFANALTISGFAIPALTTRRAETVVELAPRQHLAIAGLLDNRLADQVDKIPLLGDLPIIGALFRAKTNTQDRTELLVLVTPHIVEPSNVPYPVPPGEPSTWRWDSRMRPDTVNRTNPQVRRGGGGSTP